MHGNIGFARISSQTQSTYAEYSILGYIQIHACRKNMLVVTRLVTSKLDAAPRLCKAISVQLFEATAAQRNCFN